MKFELTQNTFNKDRKHSSFYIKNNDEQQDVTKYCKKDQ